MKLARRLYDARKQLCRDRNLDRIIVGGRIPGYGEHAEKMSTSEYVEQVVIKALHDPVLTAQISNGFALQGLIPNYFPSDEASRGYATFLEWRNLDYHPKAKCRHQRPVELTRLAVVQYQMRRVSSFEEFAKNCEFFVDVASDYSCDFVMFPELFTTQLLSCVEPTRPGLAARRLAEFTPQYLEFFAECAVKYTVNLVAGSHFVVEDETLYKIAYCFWSRRHDSQAVQAAHYSQRAKVVGRQSGRQGRRVRYGCRSSGDADLLRHQISRTGPHRRRERHADHPRAV